MADKNSPLLLVLEIGAKADQLPGFGEVTNADNRKLTAAYNRPWDLKLVAPDLAMMT